MSMYDPYDPVRQIMRDLDRWDKVANPMRDTLAAAKELELKLLQPTRQFDSVVESIREQLAVWDKATLYNFNTSALTALYDSAAYEKLNKLMADQGKLATLRPEIYGLSSALFDPSERIRETLANIEASARLYKPAPALLDLALDLPIYYQSFTADQFEKTKEEGDEVAERRVEVIEAAGELLDRSEETVQMAAEMASEGSSAVEEEPDTNEQEEERSPISVNLFRSLELYTPQIIARSSVESIQEAIVNTLPGKICEVGLRIAGRVFDINRISEYGGSEVIFKPTNEAMMSMAALPCSIAFNSVEFGVVIDRLFFLLYEGSGEANRIKPIIQFDEIPELMLLKNLRRGYRHDLDHGKPAEALKKKKNVGEAFKELIGKPYPTESNEWPLAQFRLYEKLSAMLDRILERLVASGF